MHHHGRNPDRELSSMVHTLLPQSRRGVHEKNGIHEDTHELNSDPLVPYGHIPHKLMLRRIPTQRSRAGGTSFRSAPPDQIRDFADTAPTPASCKMHFREQRAEPGIVADAVVNRPRRQLGDGRITCVHRSVRPLEGSVISKAEERIRKSHRRNVGRAGDLIQARDEARHVG